MKQKRTIAAVLALVLALSGAGALWWYAHTADQRAVEGLAPVDVFVATGDIPAGMSLGAAIAGNLLTVQQIPKRLAPADASTKVDSSNTGNVAVTEIRPGELVMVSRFAPPQVASSGLPLPQGLIAVSVDVADTPRVGNFVHPGTSVTIFLISPTADGKGKQTQLLLSNVLVLAVGDSTNPGTGPAQVPSTRLTVAVDQHSAEKLIQSTTAGTLYLGLRNAQSDVAPAGPVNDANLFR